MSREFGINKEDAKYWIGCRAIIDSNNRLDVPWDRWSAEFGPNNDKKQTLLNFTNDYALGHVSELKSKGSRRGSFAQLAPDGNLCFCEYDERNSGGYMYLGFYIAEKNQEEEAEEHIYTIRYTETCARNFRVVASSREEALKKFDKLADEGAYDFSAMTCIDSTTEII